MTINDRGRSVRASLGVRDWIAMATVLVGIAYSYLRMQWTTERLQVEVAQGNDRQERIMREMSGELRQMRVAYNEISHRVTRLEAARETTR